MSSQGLALSQVDMATTDTAEKVEEKLADQPGFAATTDNIRGHARKPEPAKQSQDEDCNVPDALSQPGEFKVVSGPRLALPPLKQHLEETRTTVAGDDDVNQIAPSHNTTAHGQRTIHFQSFKDDCVIHT